MSKKVSQRQSIRFSFHLPPQGSEWEEKEKKRKTLNNSKTVVLIKDNEEILLELRNEKLGLLSKSPERKKNENR